MDFNKLCLNFISYYTQILGLKKVVVPHITRFEPGKMIVNRRQANVMKKSAHSVHLHIRYLRAVLHSLKL